MTFEEDIREAVSCLRKGGILLYPTDTVWGIGCDATNPDAVKRIYDLKRREESKSMLVLVDGEGTLMEVIVGGQADLSGTYLAAVNKVLAASGKAEISLAE